MKVAINRCWGGFNLSALGMQRLAALHGRECHFYTIDPELNEAPYEPITLDQAMHTFWFAYDIAEVTEKFPYSITKPWKDLSPEEHEANDKFDTDHRLDPDPVDRADPLLIQVLEELGDAAISLGLSKVVIIEIPDGVDFYIDRGDGYEVIREKHRTWC